MSSNPDFRRLNTWLTQWKLWYIILIPKTVAKPFLQDIPETQHESFIEAVKDGTASKLKNKQGEWFADYVRLRFLAVKK